MHKIVSLWFGQNADPIEKIYAATILSTVISLFDSGSDLFVAIQLFIRGEWAWGTTVLLLDYLPMWNVLLHASNSPAWKEVEDSKEKWITTLILIFAPFAFPLLQLRWLLGLKTTRRGTFNYLHQNARLAELVSGMVESPLQFLVLVLLYAYNKLPLPWTVTSTITDSLGNEFNIGALPGVLSLSFSAA